jgi:hypothetical protein
MLGNKDSQSSSVCSVLPDESVDASSSSSSGIMTLLTYVTCAKRVSLTLPRCIAKVGGVLDCQRNGRCQSQDDKVTISS